jgi:hypothetical protein
MEFVLSRDSYHLSCSSLGVLDLTCHWCHLNSLQTVHWHCDKLFTVVSTVSSVSNDLHFVHLFIILVSEKSSAMHIGAYIGVHKVYHVLLEISLSTLAFSGFVQNWRL